MTHATDRAELLAAVRRLTGGSGEPPLDPSRSAADMETVGRAVADAVRPLAPEVLLTRDDSVNAVLAHIVAREVGVQAVPFYLDEGVIGIDSDLIQGRRVVLMVAHGVQPLRLSTVGSVVAIHHGTLTGIVEAVGSPGASAEAPAPYVAVVDPGDLAAGATERPGDGHGHER